MAAASQNFQYGHPTPGPQSPTVQNVMDHVYFCSNSEWKQIREVEQFDYVVIGTGPCGLAFVERVLSQKPMSRILMLERGGYFLPEHFQNLPHAFAETIGGLSETFPWTLSRDTAKGKYIKFQHGMVPFFGGRSTLWSSWCPRPNEKEFFGWPEAVIKSANDYYDKAEKLLNVVEIGSCDQQDGLHLPNNSLRPIYDTLHCDLYHTINQNLSKVPFLTRSMAAPLAVGITQLAGINFQKFATAGPLLELKKKQTEAEKESTGKPLKIATNCIVEKIYHQGNVATALKTSRGVVNLGDAKLVLAMGTIPPATLLMNSFDCIPNVGKFLAAHFISAIVGRISIEDLGYNCDSKRLKNIELGAVYIAGIENDYRKQFHIQLSAFYDSDPIANAKYAFQYAPDVVATASREQLESSKGYVVYVLACLGEMDVNNNKNNIKKNEADNDETTNIILNLTTNSVDENLWDVMDESSFGLLEQIISPKDEDGKHKVQYWHGKPSVGEWKSERPLTSQIRVPGTVHESSTLIIGSKTSERTSIGFDYRPHGVENVYVTGNGLWPRSGSWNPTLTMVGLAQHLADNLISLDSTK